MSETIELRVLNLKNWHKDLVFQPFTIPRDKDCFVNILDLVEGYNKITEEDNVIGTVNISENVFLKTLAIFNLDRGGRLIKRCHLTLEDISSSKIMLMYGDVITLEYINTF